MGLGELKQQCYYRRPFTVVFDGELAGSSRREYVGVRHPLVRAAVQSIRTGEGPRVRCANVSVASAHVDQPALVLIYLMQTTGLRPRLELIPLAIEMITHARCDEVGFALMQALTSGSWKASRVQHPLKVQLDALDAAQRVMEEERHLAELFGLASNAALVDARVASQTAAVDIKVEQARATLANVAGRDARLTRIYEGRIRNLTTRREGIRDELAGKRALAVSVRPVGLAIVQPE